MLLNTEIKKNLNHGQFRRFALFMGNMSAHGLRKRLANNDIRLSLVAQYNEFLKQEAQRNG